MITRPGFPMTYPVRSPVPAIAPPGASVVGPYPTTTPPGTWMGRSGKASWNPAAGPVYVLHRWAGIPFTLGTPKIAADPSDPQTWQRPYVFIP